MLHGGQLVFITTFKLWVDGLRAWHVPALALRTPDLAPLQIPSQLSEAFEKS